MKKYSLLLLIFLPLLFGNFSGHIPFKRSDSENENALEPDDWAFYERAYPYGIIDEHAQKNAAASVYQEKINNIRSKRSDDWEFVGPSHRGGRIIDIEMPKGSTSTVYAGSASGGVFKSYNLGNSWFPD